MNTITRWDQSRGLTSLQDQVNRLFEDNFTRDRSGHADMATWAPPVDIYETENELVVKADLPDLQEQGHRRTRRKQYVDHPRRAEVREGRQRGQLPPSGTRLWFVHAELFPTKHGQLREHSGRVSQWGLEPAYGEA